MIIRINNFFKKRNGVADETGAALIFALLLLMIMIFLSVVVTMTAATQAQSSRELVLREAYSAAATEAIETALFNANNSTTNNWLSTKLGIGNAVTGIPTAASMNIDGLRWRMYTEPVAGVGNGVSYYIYATGYLDTLGVAKGITLRTMVTGIPVWNTTISGGQITYSLNPESSWALGLTGIDGVEFAGSSKIYSFNSGRNGRTPSGTSNSSSKVATNTTGTIANNAHGIRVLSSSLRGATGTTGCIPSAVCNTAPALQTVYRGSLIQLGGTGALVAGDCPNASYPIWKASENGGVLNIPSNSCVGGLIFDTTTTVPANFNDSNPLNILVKGTVTVNANVNVNQTNVPTALIMRNLNGATLNLSGTTKANFLYTGQSTDCTLNNTAVLFGGLACKTVKLYNSSIFYVDEAALDRTDPSSNRRVWDRSYIEEV